MAKFVQLTRGFRRKKPPTTTTLSLTVPTSPIVVNSPVTVSIVVQTTATIPPHGTLAWGDGTPVAVWTYPTALTLTHTYTSARTFTISMRDLTSGALASAPIVVTPVSTPINCVVSAWGPWQTLDATHQIRYRTITTQPSNGGQACPPLSEIRAVPPPPPPPPPPPDTTPPTVAWVSPASGTVFTLGTPIVLTATASDNVAVQSVQFLESGNPVATIATAPYAFSWVPPAVGTYLVTALATDTSSNHASTPPITVLVQAAPPPPPPPDTTPPVVSLTVPTNNTTVNGTVTVSATATDNVAVAKVVFQANGVTIGTVVGVGPSYSVSWPTGANGTYALTAIATDTSGNSTTSAVVTVTVTQIVIDHTPPTVSLTAPTSGTVVSGTGVAITATASDNIAVASIQALVNGTPIGVLTGSGATLTGQITSWDTTTLANGQATITAIATDTAGNKTTSAAVTVTINNVAVPPPPPTCAITAPVNGATVNGVVTISATASGTVPIAQVQFRVNGLNLGAAITIAPYQTTWTTGANGTYTIDAVATDTSGVPGQATPITVTVTQIVPPPPDTTPPTVHITVPTNGASITTNITLTATASDNVGVVGVQFAVNAINVGAEVLVAPYTRVWSIAGLAPGSYTITAKARDAAGNTAIDTVQVFIPTPPPPPPPPGPLLGPANLVYVGAFAIPGGPAGTDQDSANYGGTALGFNAAGNGGHGSLLIAGFTDYTGFNQRVAEISIPTPVNTANLGSLPTATLLHDFTDILSGHLNDIEPGGNNGIVIGGLAVAGGKIVVACYSYYDAGTPTSLSHFLSHLDFSGYLSGPFQIGSVASMGGWMGGYMATIPSAYQAALGGPWFTGQNSIPIIGRTSLGPAATVFDPAQLGVTNPVPATTVVGYDINHPTLGTWQSSGGLWNGGTRTNAGIAFPSGTRSVLFFGVYGSGPFCYGELQSDPALAGQLAPGGDVYCYDPMDSGIKGTSNYPYNFNVWAYDVNDLIAVKNATKNAYDVMPYQHWAFTMPIVNPSGPAANYSIGSVAYDDTSRRIFVAQQNVDAPTGATTIINVFQVTP
jgi:hypothetical protein